MTAYELILKKRSGGELTADEIRELVQTYTHGGIPDYQMSALLMAVYFKGMSFGETTALTVAMRDSGKVTDLSRIPGYKVDKHSTGGVGDKISLILAPLAASLGLVVPMISGRGLGHTGGTLDKLESIPGFNVSLSLDRFKTQLERLGVCMIGQTDEIAPADRKLYALRDVTATVDSVPLICASILSKKLAEGIDGLVLDVKAGSGAFMKTVPEAMELARNLIIIGESAGKSVVAVVSNMDEPLGLTVGNWLEVLESIDVLQGGGPSDVRELTLDLVSRMQQLANPALRYEEAYGLAENSLKNGLAFQRFLQMVEAQGGDPGVIQQPVRAGSAPYQRTVESDEDGFVISMDCRVIGQVSVGLGAGRATKEEDIDPLAGIHFYKKVGQKVSRGEPLCTLLTGRPDALSEAAERIRRAIRVERNAPDKHPLVLAVLDRHRVLEQAADHAETIEFSQRN